jgi:peptide chain release factor subunit 1
MNKHKKGGWSQARFARLRKGAIDRFMKEVAEDVEAQFTKDHVQKVVIAGPGNAKTQFQDYLSQQVREKIVDLIEMEFDEPEGTLISRATEIVIQDEKDKDEEHVTEWREEILKNGLAVYGEKETKVAVLNGQVELLLVNKTHKKAGWKCEHCQFTDLGSRDECPYCGGVANDVDFIEEIVESAIQQDTKIDFIDDNPTLNELGGVGGLLRYK